MPGKKRQFFAQFFFMTAKLAASFFLPCRHRPVMKMQVFRPISDPFRLFLRMTKKACPSDRKKTSRISAARNSSFRAAARIYVDRSGPYCCSGRQLSATLSATASQYLAAVRGGHALAEAVLLGALTLLRLERSLHNFVHLPVRKFYGWAPA